MLPEEEGGGPPEPAESPPGPEPGRPRSYVSSGPVGSPASNFPRCSKRRKSAGDVSDLPDSWGILC
jgi:hypothetical protein